MGGPKMGAAALVAAFLSLGATCGKQVIKDAADLQIYCCDPVEGHPDRCVGLPVPVPCAGYVPRVTPTPTPGPGQPIPTPTSQPPGPLCEKSAHVLCDCWLRLNDAWIRQDCPTSTPSSPSPTAPTTPTPTGAPTFAPTPTTTPTTAPVPAPTVPCLDPNTVPTYPVPAVQSGPCRPGFRRLDYDGGHLCLADWYCADGDNSKNCPNKLDPDINTFHNLTPGADGFIHDGEHPRTDAYCRNITDDGAIIVPQCAPPPPLGDGYCPAPWERAAVCRPVICAAPTAAPAPTPPVPAPTPVGPGGPGHGCQLPVGTGDGVDCPRTSPQLMAQVSAAIDQTVSAHRDWVDPAGTIVLPGHANDFRNAVAGALIHDGLCAFFDGEEIAVKNVNSFSEQYAVVSSAMNIRRGENSYRATCTPAWKAIPGPASVPLDAETPLLVLVRVGDHCQNPSDGPKYANHICIVTTTGVYRDQRTPDDGSRDSPCDREPALTDFCNHMSQDDPRGILYTVDGAQDLGLDPDNPQQVEVRFEPGREFTVCARPYPDPRNSKGETVRVIGDPSQCKSQTQGQ